MSIGEIGRKFKTRISEHNPLLTLTTTKDDENEKKVPGFASHLIETGHPFHSDSYSFLHMMKDNFKKRVSPLKQLRSRRRNIAFKTH